LPAVIEQFHPFPLTRETARRLAHERTRDRYYVAVDREQVVGFMMLRGWEDGYDVPSFGFLVDQAARGKGIGHMLAAFAIEEARRLGAERVRATVYASNLPSRAAMEANGFVEESRQPVERPSGPDERIVVTTDLKH
jgi:RimJ/RimL family protein N-acetyltransferase